MAFTSTAHTAPTLLERIVDFKNTLAERRAKYVLYRDTLNELNSLSGRELADLGMSRANLKSIAYEAAYKV